MSDEQTFGQATGAPQDVTADPSTAITTTTTTDADVEHQAHDQTLTPEQQQEIARREWEEQQAVQNKPWFKKRLDKLTYQRHEAERQAQAERQRADQLQTMLDRSMTKQNDSILPLPVQAAQKPKPVIDNFETDQEYFEALSDWKLESYQAQEAAKKEYQQQQRQQQQAQQQQAQFDTWFRNESNRAMMTGEQNYMDWDQVVLPVINTQMPVNFGAEILQTDNPSDVLYGICKNPAEMNRIMQIQSPVRRAIELSKFDSQLQASKKKGGISNAPPVMTPVKGTKTNPVAPDPKDTEAWIKARRAEKMKRGVR